MRLNLGSGWVRKQDYLNIDSNPDTNPDIVAKVPPLDFADNSVEEIYASHFLEHVEDIVFLMNECFRVLKPGGIMNIRVPYALSHAAFQDPYHVRFFVPESFLYFTESCAYLKYPITARFEILENSIVGQEVVVRLQKPWKKSI